MKTLYLDMDGVLCNFDGAWIDWKINRYKSKFCDVWPGTEAAWEIEFTKFIDEVGFSSLPKHRFYNQAIVIAHYAQSVLGYNLGIMTSVGTFDKYLGDKVREQKWTWLYNDVNLGKDAWGLYDNMVTVSDGQQKPANLGPRDILLDDLLTTCSLDPNKCFYVDHDLDNIVEKAIHFINKRDSYT